MGAPLHPVASAAAAGAAVGDAPGDSDALVAVADLSFKLKKRLAALPGPGAGTCISSSESPIPSKSIGNHILNLLIADSEQYC